MRMRSLPQEKLRRRTVLCLFYLINACGFSPIWALATSKRIRFETTKGPDRILALFRNYGFTETQITKVIELRPDLLLANPTETLAVFRNYGFTETQISTVIRKFPDLLQTNPTETLIPKFEFFHSVGLQDSDIAKIISRDPLVLFSSLERGIIPSFNLFKEQVGTVENVFNALKHQTLFLRYDLQDMAQKIATLREIGVPESGILKILTFHPKIISIYSDRFHQRVTEIKQSGFDGSPFAIALLALSSLSTFYTDESTWKQKLEAFGSWGFSEDDVISTFGKYPRVISLRLEKIRGQLDFLLNKMGWECADILKNPQILGYNLEKRVIPRCSVLRVLQLKGLVERDQSIRSVVTMKIDSFMEKFVKKYEKEVPNCWICTKGVLVSQN